MRLQRDREFVMKRIGIGLLVIMPVLLGQAGSQPADLASEVARLKAENARLQRELERTRGELAAATQGVNRPAADARAAATQAEDVRVFGTMLEVLEKVPGELKPQANAEWYKFTEGKFTGWWKEQMVGMTFEKELKIGKPTVWKNPSPTAREEWVVYPIPFETQKFTYVGKEQTWHISTGMLYVDEAAARKWDAVKEGTVIKVKGEIHGVRFTQTNMGQHSQMPAYRVILDLGKVTYDLKK